MGKMLEALQQSGGPKPRTPEPAPVAAGPAVEAEEEMSFIEVGGKRGPLEASPDVLATAPPTPILKLPRLVAPAVEEPEPAGLTVQFRPVQAELPPPQARFAPELIAFHRPDSPLSRQYQGLGTSLLASLAAGRARVLMFTAVAPGAGTTTVLLNVAISFARQGKLRVVVVDANLQQPAVAERFGLPAVPGLAEVLGGAAALPDVLQETGQPNLLALTAGDTSCRPRLGGEAMRSLVRQLRERFELVLLDTACWPAQPGLLPLATACDAAYLVSPAAEAQGPEAEGLLQEMRRQGVPVRGHLLTAR
jgi:Mrp family chromosome partitioning ATPase